MTEVHHERREGIAILTLDRPVSNALAPSLRAELASRLQEVARDDTVRCLVLRAAGADFSTGVDITEYNAPLTAPTVADICQQIETFPKPVVAALQGAVLGGGLELALAAHCRIAARGTRLGLPEVTLGLIPNGGATQRLPRIAGARIALDLMLSGKPVEATDPRMKGIVDAVVPDGLVDAALLAASELARTGHWTPARDRRDGFSDALGYQNTVSAALGKLPGKSLAAADIVRCVEAAQLLPYDRGLELERVRFEDRRTSADARARRHFQTALRRADIMPERAKGKARDIRNVVIAGSGSLVIELALACLDRGAAVTLVATDIAASEALRDRVSEIYDNAVSRGIMTADIRDRLMEKLVPAPPQQALAQTDMALDTGQFDLRSHHATLHPEAVWVSVTTGGPMPGSVLQEIARRQVGLRMYRPAFRTKLVELCVPHAASADTVVTVAEFFGHADRTTIRCECVDGLIGDNMSAAFFSAALALANAGLGPYRIDAAARALGFAKGPFRLIDEEGLPAVADRLGRRVAAGRAVDTAMLAERIASGATGWSAGRGFYIYDEKGAHHDPDQAARTNGNVPPSWIEVRTAIEAALANEAARLISAQVVQRASDIDVVMVRGYGFDQTRGGPLFQADLRGLFGTLKETRRLAEISEALWQPHPLVEDMVKNGVGFFGRPG